MHRGQHYLLLAFGAALGAVALALAGAANAQPKGKTYRVAYIYAGAQAPGTDPPFLHSFLRGLRERGYTEGANLVFDRRTAAGDYERVTAITKELVDAKTDVLLVGSVEFARLAHQVTKSLPIVFFGGDPVGAGLVRSLAQPGTNLTGITSDVGGGTQEKRFELLLAVAPKARRVGFIGRQADWDNVFGRAVRDAAAARKVTLLLIESKTTGFTEAFAKAREQNPDAVFIAFSPAAYFYRQSVGEFAAASTFPTSCGFGDAVDLGCLMSYGVDLSDVFYRLAAYVDRILRGAKPAEMPVEQPTKFDLVINKKTAKAIGLNIPDAFLMRADRVVE